MVFLEFRAAHANGWLIFSARNLILACPKFIAMKKVNAERTSSFASGCDLAGQLSGSYPNSRSSCEQRQALAIFAAHWTAVSRDGSSRTQKPPSNSLVCG